MAIGSKMRNYAKRRDERNQQRFNKSKAGKKLNEQRIQALNKYLKNKT